jgi:hypothetical protein
MWVSPYTVACAIVGRKQEQLAPDLDLRIDVPSGSEQFDGVDVQ